MEEGALPLLRTASCRFAKNELFLQRSCGRAGLDQACVGVITDSIPQQMASGTVGWDGQPVLNHMAYEKGKECHC